MSLRQFYERLSHTPGLTALKVAQLIQSGLTVEQVAERHANPVTTLSGDTSVTPACQDYPQRLLHLNDPPLQIFYQGKPPSAIKGVVVGIVGSRKASHHGLRLARELGRTLTRRGASVCSGLALGIDGAAHQGVIEQLRRDPNGGSPIAVLGHGLAYLHPSEHRELAQSVRQTGTLLTEYPHSFSPTKWSFPARNRLIAALSDHLVVVEAGARSGSLHTARFADDLGRSVWVVPNAPGRPNSEGVLKLHQSGAHLIYNVEEFAEQVVPSQRKAKRSKSKDPTLSPTKREILNLLARADGRTDLLCQQSKLSPTELACLLTELELDGHVCRQLDGLWVVR